MDIAWTSNGEDVHTMSRDFGAHLWLNDRLIDGGTRVMIRTLVFAVLGLIALAGSPAGAADSSTLSMQLGGERVIDLQRAPRAITISDPNVVDVQRVGLTNSIRLVPQSSGKANLLLEFPEGGAKEYRIQVGAGKEVGTVSTLSQSSGLRVARALTQVAGVEAVVENGRVVLTGCVRDIDDFRTISRTLAASPQSFLSSLTVAPSIEALVAEDLTRTVAFLGGSQLTVTLKQGITLLGGVSEGVIGKQNALSYLRSIFPAAMDAATEQDGSLNLVQIDLHFLEVTQSSSLKLGISRAKGPLTSTNLSPTLLGQSALLSTNLNIFFDALSQAKGARELAHPTLLTRSGNEVEFLAGGEVPIISGRERSNNNGSVAEKVEYKTYGIAFRSRPLILPNGKIAIDLNAQFSGVDEGLSKDLAPAFHTRKLQTSITLEPGKAAILTGLVRAKDGKSIEKLPGLGSIPILGELFKHRDVQDENSELWIVIAAKPTRSPEPAAPTEIWEKAKQKSRISVFD